MIEGHSYFTITQAFTFTYNCSRHVLFQAVVWTGWALSIGMTFILVHGLYGDLGPIMSAAYVALSHTAWAIAVGWIVIACSTGNGGQYVTPSHTHDK
jgi:hypothetical protein